VEALEVGERVGDGAAGPAPAHGGGDAEAGVGGEVAQQFLPAVARGAEEGDVDRPVHRAKTLSSTRSASRVPWVRALAAGTPSSVST